PTSTPTPGTRARAPAAPRARRRWGCAHSTRRSRSGSRDGDSRRGKSRLTLSQPRCVTIVSEAKRSAEACLASQSREALDLWRRVLVESLRGGGPDLSQRQLSLLLTVYLTPPPHTVRGLAELLRVSKPAISR